MLDLVLFFRGRIPVKLLDAIKNLQALENHPKWQRYLII